VDLDEFRQELSPYSAIGRPSTTALELMVRMLLVGYCSGTGSELRVGEEVYLNLAYRRSWARALHRTYESYRRTTGVPLQREHALAFPREKAANVASALAPDSCS